MFTVEQIEQAHSKVKSGADFPNYIKDIKQLGVKSFETWVEDSHTVYYGHNNFQTSSKPKYSPLIISDTNNKEQFLSYLKAHQQGKTDYVMFCNHCAETGIEKWIVNLDAMTCTYFDKAGNKIVTEKIPE